MLRSTIPVTEAVGVVVILAVGFSVAALIWPGMHEERVTDWAQAIGSIGAIIFAWMMGMWTSRQQEKRIILQNAHKAYETTEACFQLSRHAVALHISVARMFRVSCDQTLYRDIGPERINAHMRAIEAFFSKDIPPSLYTALLELHRNIAHTLTAVRQYNEKALPADDQRHKEAEVRLKQVLETKDRIEDLYIDVKIEQRTLNAWK